MPTEANFRPMGNRIDAATFPSSGEMLLSHGPPGTQDQAAVTHRWRLLLNASLHGHFAFLVSLSLFPHLSSLASLPKQPKPKSLSQDLLFWGHKLRLHYVIFLKLWLKKYRI